MATRFRCLKCLKIIECSPYDSSTLLQHIRLEHPDILIEHNFSIEPVEADDESKTKTSPECLEDRLPPLNLSMEEESVRFPGQKPMYTRKYKIRTPLTPKSPQKRRMYKTSIEKWHHAEGRIYCPKCGTNKIPIIRSRSEKMSYSTAGAACILTCWPLCFLPCLFPAGSKDYLHCAECHNFLGMYDKNNNCVRPNRDFVECDGCEKNLSEKLNETTMKEHLNKSKSI